MVSHLRVGPPRHTSLALGEAVAIWQECLGTDDVDAHTHLMRSGGTSLTAAAVAAHVRRLTGSRVRVADIVTDPTPTGLVELLNARGRERPETRDGLELVAGFAGDDPAPISEQQQAIWFLERLSTGNHAYNSVAAIRLPTPPDLERLRVAATAVVLRHEVLRTRFVRDGGRLVQQVDPLADAQVVTESPRSGADLEQRLAEIGNTPFDVGQTPLVRWHVIPSADDGSTVLAQVEHHFVHDGWSTWVVLRDLAQAYRGEPLAAPSSTSYRDFAAWQEQWKATPEARAQREHWTTRLADVTGTVRLGDEARRPEVFEHHGGTYRQLLSEEDGRLVTDTAARLGVTPFTLLWTAFGAVVTPAASGGPFAIGTTQRNRRPGVEETVGMFVNTTALPYPSPDATESFRSVLATTAGSLAHAHDHQEIPFAQVVRHLVDHPSLDRNPVFQVCFSANDWPDQSVDFGDGPVDDIDYPPTGAKFDLDVVAFSPAANRSWMLLWRYYAAVLDRDDAIALSERFVGVLRAVAADPDVPFAVLAAVR